LAAKKRKNTKVFMDNEFLESQALPSTPAATDEAPPVTTAQNEAVETSGEDELAQPEPPEALPEADLPQPPRPLVAGAFLGGEYEVKDLVERGLTNFYLAFGGDYSAPVPKLVAERETPHHDENSPESSGEKPALESALFPPSQFTTSGDREYLIFDWVDSIALQDWREVANDARYLQAVSTLAQGMRELETQNLQADFSRETLRFDDKGNLRYFGFTDALPPNQTPASDLLPLRELNTFLLRQVFGESGTIRLDDQWAALAMSEEVKSFARNLEENFSSLEDVVQALQSLPHSAAGALRAEAALLTDVGQEREINEDSGMVMRFTRGGHGKSFDLELYAVSDGMGGHEGGEVASDLTLSTLQRAMESRLDIDWNDNVAVRRALGEVIEEVNQAVVALTESEKYRATRAKPGATLTFAARIGARVFFGNVGDSRAYLWSTSRGLQRVTKDHSYVQTLIDAGELSEEDSWDHPDGSIITANIGMQKLRQRDVFLRLVAPGDKILIVSDGVIDMLRETEIAPFLESASPHEICRNLVDAANDAGGHDNITAVCVCFS
jgi:protein phosphatase